MNPTYRSLGDHTETIQIDFDPAVVSYEDLLEVFWASHRPTREPWSVQYRSAIFHHDARQERLANESRDREAARLGETVHTAIEPLGTFHRAEDYHQKYRLRHSAAMEVFEALHPDARAFTDSTAAARANAFLDGHLDREELAAELERLELPEDARARLLEALRG